MSGAFFNPQSPVGSGDNASPFDNLDPVTAQKLAKLLQQAQTQNPTQNTPFGNAGQAGGQLLSAYLAKQLMNKQMAPPAASQMQGNAGNVAPATFLQKLQSMFNLGGGGASVGQTNTMPGVQSAPYF